MSTLHFDRAGKKITLKASDGKEVGNWDAENNVVSTASPWPAGTYKFSWWSPHSGGDADSQYGSNGNFIFEVSGRSGMGVHAGRATTKDAHGNAGPGHVTEGCIRTTDAATASIKSTHASDALTTIEVN